MRALTVSSEREKDVGGKKLPNWNLFLSLFFLKEKHNRVPKEQS